MDGPRRLLVIKLSALGDFVMSIGAIQAIRRHHAGDALVLLTTPPYQSLAGALGCFQEVWLDQRPGLLDVAGWTGLARRIRRGGFARVYDLQRSGRTAWYFRLLGRAGPEWVGVVPGCSHRYVPPPGQTLHIAEREAAQLALAGIERVGPPDLSCVSADLGHFALPARYALLVPGGAPHRPAKRWPAGRYAALARALAARGITPLLLGTEPDRAPIDRVARDCPAARDLCGRTGLEEIVALARGAALAVGNDTGPMHLITAAGCPVISLFSRDSDPAKVAPRGRSVTVLHRPALDTLTVEEVLGAVPTALQPVP